MSVEKELKEIRHLDYRIDTKIRQLDQLRMQIGSLKSFDYSKDRVQETSRLGSEIENLVIKICDLEEEITKEIDLMVDKKSKVRETISKIDGLGGSVMEMRYLENMSWEDIASTLNISLQYAYKLHNEEIGNIKIVE